MRFLNRYLTFDRNKKINQLLDKLSIPFKEEEKSLGEGSDYYSLEFFLYEEDIYFKSKSKEVAKFKIEPQIGTEFSKEDEENAEWFWMSTGQFGYPQPQDNYFALTYSNENVCLQCQIGKQQINSFRLKAEPKAKHSQFLGLNWIFDELFVREQAIECFAKNKIGGIRYSRPVLNKTKLPSETLQQLHVDTILQLGLLTDDLEFEICQKPTDKKQIAFIKTQNPSYLEKEFCGHKKYNFPKRGAMTFKKEIFVNQPDFVKPFEWFGSGGSATRPILVSQKVRQLVIKHKLRGASFTPITLI
ncbi:MAG: hypothetical protein V4722_17900 [Bacteroidota bacterium]